MTSIHENSFEPAQFLVENVGLLPKDQVLILATPEPNSCHAVILVDSIKVIITERCSA